MKTYDKSFKEERFEMDGSVYVIREASDYAVSKWKNYQLKDITMDGKGKPTGSVAAADSDALLASLCVFELFFDKADQKKEDHRNLVGLPFIQSLPRRIVKDITLTVKVISGIKAEEDKALADAEAKEKAESEAKKKQGLSD